MRLEVLSDIGPHPRHSVRNRLDERGLHRHRTASARAGETITGGPLQLLPGGKSGNQAAAAARIGATVQMFGAVGSDSNADFLLGRPR